MSEMIPSRQEGAGSDALEWLNLTQSLFKRLKARVEARADIDVDGELGRLRTWEPFCLAEEENHGDQEPTGDTKGRTQYDIARALLWCAGRACRSDLPVDDLCSWTAFERITEKPVYVLTRAVWAFDCIRELRPNGSARRLTSPVPRFNTVQVVVALSEGAALAASGCVGRLTLDVERLVGVDVTRHGPDVFQHPVDAALVTYVRPDFEKSIADAWSAARALAQVEGIDIRGTVARWRLQLPNLVDTVEGTSASAAAARGLWNSLTARVPDPAIIVFAVMAPDGVLLGVGGIPVKTKAAAARPEIDTIVVVDDEGEDIANNTLERIGADGRIHVVNLSQEQTSGSRASSCPPTP